jgi:hypothetical protein
VASPATLIVANLHKISERENTPTRLFMIKACVVRTIAATGSDFSITRAGYLGAKSAAVLGLMS